MKYIEFIIWFLFYENYYVENVYYKYMYIYNVW